MGGRRGGMGGDGDNGKTMMKAQSKTTLAVLRVTKGS